MGKKRAKDRGRSPKEDSSVDLAGVTCTHIRKGTDPSWLRKTSLDKSWDACETCEQEKETENEDEDKQDTAGIWMCLKCGHRGCGRFSENKHAIKHYETPRSDPHCLVLSLDNWNVWCYICDDTIYYSSTGQLAQLVSNIKKQMLAESRHKTATRKAKEEKNTSADTVQEHEVVKEPEKKEEPKENKKCVKRNGQETQSSGVPVRGLSNLGNTCFFNAVLQNLSQTWLLRQLLSDFRDEEKSVLITPSPSSELDPLQVRLPRPGSLTLAMCQLLNEIQETKKGVVTPRELFTQVCKKAARFKGFQQQDSQELLRYLLDGMRAEESIRVTAGILNVLKSSGKTSEPEQKKLVKEYDSNGGTKSFVERVFGGELTSTVMCTECKTVSVVTEVFLDLSLPVADEAYRKKKGGGDQQKKSESMESGRSVEAPLTNGIEDMPMGTGSKYQQKKAKKQAKKQAKTQRRQQKQGTKLTLDLLTNQSEDASLEAPPPSTDEQPEAEGGANEPVSQLEPAEQDQNRETPEGDEEGSEAQNSASNRFITLSEEGTEKQEADEEDENDEAELSKSVRALSISEDQRSKEVGSGAESEPEELGAEPEFVVVVNADPKAAFSTLSSRAALSASESSVESSLLQFTQVEQLTHTNSLLCLTCSQRAAHGGKKKVYTEALKQMLISSPPPVLTLHLKRFQQVGYSVCKVNRHVQFPQVLDLGPFCSAKCKGVEEGQTQLLYSLYGIVEHSGTMRSGHYTAFVKARPHTPARIGSLNGASGDEVPPKGSWFHISDSSVQSVTEARVQTSQAYLLFYERIS
ncbi:ubiquitin carboxyl-terminal hydrolase 16 isoform X1 [Ictalurus punctatus]|uniref:Ubiquitin carboxyl-terminal hydrolase n=1 Tax=Ictalurus punctatus TaxID=7998 RepID=A0A2D0SUI2_ICTPU|nr:ubiquitin carboxyl-terminal hydrolase 16 isoform X1 [Ictalurus punctatus]XP_017346352.1 ubiquitin carboxyl-terminal hydrolase 16 isoform X1 [Ictalurus punctatus]